MLTSLKVTIIQENRMTMAIGTFSLCSILFSQVIRGCKILKLYRKCIYNLDIHDIEKMLNLIQIIQLALFLINSDYSTHPIKPSYRSHLN